MADVNAPELVSIDEEIGDDTSKVVHQHRALLVLGPYGVCIPENFNVLSRHPGGVAPLTRADLLQGLDDLNLPGQRKEVLKAVMQEPKEARDGALFNLDATTSEASGKEVILTALETLSE